MKISRKAFFLSVCWVAVLSFACYFALMLLCERFAEALKPFVFFVSTLFFIVFFYLAAAHFKTFSAKLSGGELLISKGFLIKRKIHLNLKYALSVKLLTTPLMRLLGLVNLLIVFEGSVCVLPLLKAVDGDEIFKARDKNEKL